MYPTKLNRVAVPMLAVALAAAHTSCGIFAPAVITRTPTQNTPPYSGEKIPTPTQTTTPAPPVVAPPKPPRTPTTPAIALVLPLKMTDTGSTNLTQKGLDSTLQFYQGFALAMDTLAKAGLSATINVIDNPTNTNDFLQNTTYNLIAQYQPDDGVKVYLSKNTTPTDTAAYAQYNINPSMPEHIQAVLAHINQNYYNSKLTIIHRPQRLEMQVADNFMQQYNALNPTTPPTQITNDKPKLIDIQPALIKGKNNIIYLCTFDETYVMNLMRELKTVAEPYNITIVGLPSWRNFKIIELEQFEKYHVVVSSANTADYTEPPTAAYNFRKQYFVKYGTEPRLQAYKGYDTGLYFGNLLLKNNNNNANNTLKTPPQPTPMLHNIYQFNNTNTPNIYQNIGVNILQYKNYKFEK